MNNFTNILREHNLKATPQRLAMMELIFLNGHINIDSLYLKVKERFSSISLATIYKNVNAMTKNLLLLEVKLPNEKSVFEISKEVHSHLLCSKCGNVIDIKIDTATIENKIATKYHFKIEQTDLVVSGICKKCS